MSDEENHSEIELSIGGNDVHISGSEDFVSEQLSTVLSELEFDDPTTPRPDGAISRSANRESDVDPESKMDEVTDDHSGFDKVAESLDVGPELLQKYFFISSDGELHLENPLNMEPRYALLGYLTIETERTGKQVFDNGGMKNKLVSEEGIDLGDSTWGDIVYNARRSGDIRDDPDTTQERNKPFRLTRDGREKFIEWLNEDD